jgi:hypothetical protein
MKDINHFWFEDLLPTPMEKPIKLSEETMLKLLKEQQFFDYRVNVLNNYVERQIDIKVQKKMKELGYGDWAAYDIIEKPDHILRKKEDGKELVKIKKAYWKVKGEMKHKATLAYSKKYIAIFMEELKTIQSLAPKDEDGRLHTVITASGWYAHLSRHCGYSFPDFDNNLYLRFNHGVITADARIGEHHTDYYKGQPLGIGNHRIATLWRLLSSEEERHDFLFKSFNGGYSLGQMTMFAEDDMKDIISHLWEIFTEEEKTHPKLLLLFMNNLEHLKA